MLDLFRIEFFRNEEGPGLASEKTAFFRSFFCHEADSGDMVNSICKLAFFLYALLVNLYPPSRFFTRCSSTLSVSPSAVSRPAVILSPLEMGPTPFGVPTRRRKLVRLTNF